MPGRYGLRSYAYSAIYASTGVGPILLLLGMSILMLSVWRYPYDSTERPLYLTPVLTREYAAMAGDRSSLLPLRPAWPKRSYLSTRFLRDLRYWPSAAYA